MNETACESCRRESGRLASRCRVGVRPAESRYTVWSVCRHGRLYPSRLTDLHDPPPVLYACGDRDPLERLVRGAMAVTIVGSRRPTAAGLDLATGLARALSEAGLLVVSGLAAGIDAAAHKGALEAGAATVAVMGGGPDLAYPASNRALHGRLVGGDGLVVAELPSGTRPTRWTFPARNRIMATLSAMTVVVEARERSGSLITAGFAAESGREVGAIPGQVGLATAAGTNALLKDGAHVVRGPDDVLDLLEGVEGARTRRRPQATGPRLPHLLREVLDRVEEEPLSADALAGRTEAGGIGAAVALARLELLGYVKCGDDGRFRRTALVAPS